MIKIRKLRNTNMRNCEKIDKLTVDKIMTREHDCYILEEVDCLSVDRVTFKLITSPKFLRLIIKAINENSHSFFLNLLSNLIIF